MNEIENSYKIFPRDSLRKIKEINRNGKAIIIGLIEHNDKYYILDSCNMDCDSYIIVLEKNIKECSLEDFKNFKN